VRLPLLLADLRDEPIARREGPAPEGPSLAGAKVVVVDDDPTAVELIKEVLVQAGGEVIECRTTDEALRAIAQQRPDALVSDIEMPGQDGYSLVRKLRALGPEQGGKIPAVALTAFGRSEDRIRSLRAGFNTHLTKPVDPAELTAIVASMIGRAG
jgi:CheY-like chemotaxis protein